MTATAVKLIGHDGQISFEQTADGLLVKLPSGSPSKHAQVLKISK
jgi:alpha-L-fucosidase